MNSNFISYFENAVKTYWNDKSMTNYVTKKTYSYSDVAHIIAKTHILFEKMNIGPKDNIALVGLSSPEWCIANLAVITYGAVAVPIMPNFRPEDIQNVINHSEASIFFVAPELWNSLKDLQMHQVRAIISYEDYSCYRQANGEQTIEYIADIDRLFAEKYPQGLNPSNVKYSDKSDEELMLISYTSGTTGFSKGVMLKGANFHCLIDIQYSLNFHQPREAFFNFLPMAHLYGCVYNLFYPFTFGLHITFLVKDPSPQVLYKALQEVKPPIISTVSLFLELNFKKAIVPLLDKPIIKYGLKVPFVKNYVHKYLREKLIYSFGCKLRNVCLGGAALNSEIEDFLHEIKFPYGMGYGMTECGPLISSEPFNVKKHSVGKPLSCLTLHIDSVDPIHIPGEILVKGKNVMMGYYKNEEATAKAFTEDGWFRTGDLGIFDEEGNLYIKGRAKSVLLTSSGQNVYPEEIEVHFNNSPYIAESLVVQRKNKFVVLVYPEKTIVEPNTTPNKLNELMESVLDEVNKKLATHECVSSFEICDEPFQRTEKGSIKRYLYK